MTRREERYVFAPSLTGSSASAPLLNLNLTTRRNP